MSIKRVVPRKRGQDPAASRGSTKAGAKREESEVSRQLQDLREQVDIVLPEMTARIAALEHLLLEKQLCIRKDLIDARQFVRAQEA